MAPMATSNICEILSIVEEQTLEQLDRYMYNLLKLIAFSITTSQAFFELSPLRHWFSELFSRIKMFSNYDFFGHKNAEGSTLPSSKAQRNITG